MISQIGLYPRATLWVWEASGELVITPYVVTLLPLSQSLPLMWALSPSCCYFYLILPNSMLSCSVYTWPETLSSETLFSAASWRTFQCSVLYNCLLGFFHMFVASLYRVKPSFFSQNSWKKKTQFFCLTFIPRDVTFWEHKGQCSVALPAVSGTRPLCCGILL